MKIVITGTSGFIGSRLLQTARAMYGDNVTAFSSHPSEGNHIVYANRTDFSLAPAELALVEDANVLIHAGAFIPKCGTEANQIKSCNSNIAFTEELLALPWRNLKRSFSSVHWTCIITLIALSAKPHLPCRPRYMGCQSSTASA